MLKKASIVSSVLLILIGIILVWQWKNYSNKILETTGQQKGKPVQEIEVSVEADRLHITQKIAGLPPERKHEIFLPSLAREPSCTISSKTGCSVKDEKLQTYYAKGDSITLKYEIPFIKGNQPVLFREWTGQIKGVSISDSSIEVADQEKGKGTWVAGIPLMTVQEFKHIDYYLFRGGNGNPALYWHPSPLNEHIVYDGKLTIFYEGSGPDSVDFPSIEKLNNFTYTSLILTDQFKETGVRGVLTVGSNFSDRENLEWKVVHHYFTCKFPGSATENEWVADVLTTLFLNRAPENEKVSHVILELNKGFTKEELNQFLSAVISEEKPLSTEILDRFLGEIKGAGTRFFTMNKQETATFFPLCFYDHRSIYVEGKLQKDLEVIYFEEERYFPVLETFKALSYDVRILADGKTVLLTRDSTNYRFYTDQNIFIFDEEDYGLLERPLRVLHDEIFIKEKWLKTIFSVVIIEEESKLEIIQITNGDFSL